MSPQICGYLLVLVAQYAVSTAPVGAPETIELFHPQMPHAPARSPAIENEAVPVIHLNTDENGKASVDAYLKMFPQELLSSNKKVRPIDVRKIEHEDFIDYEIEFLELSEEIDEDGENGENIILSESSGRFNDTIIKMLSSSYMNNAKDEDKIPLKSSSSSSILSDHSEEMNLVSFVDLLRRARIRHQSKLASDKRRRRRIKLKRDPVVSIPSDTNDSSNQVDTSHDLKRERNSYSKRNNFSKPRELIRKTPLQETNRSSGNSGNRRITLPRYNSLRGRKRIPIKSGRKIFRDDSPSFPLNKVRNTHISTKTGTSNTQRPTTIPSPTSTSTQDTFTDSTKEEENDKSIVVTRNVTSTRFVTSASLFPILTSTTKYIEKTTEKSFPTDFVPSKNLEKEMTTAFSKLLTKTTFKKVKTTLTTSPNTTLTSSTPRVSSSTIHLETSKTIDGVKQPASTTTMKPIEITTRQSLSSTTLMMYPEEFTKDEKSDEVQHEFVDENPIETISLPFSLLSLFGGRPKSSRLEIAPPPTSTYSLKTSRSRLINPYKYKEIEAFQSKDSIPKMSKTRSSSTSRDILPKITTVKSVSKFSIISTSTQTSIPLYETTTNTNPTKDLFQSESDQTSSTDSSISISTTSIPNTNSDDEDEVSTERSILFNTKFSASISVPTSGFTPETQLPDVSRTTTSPNLIVNSAMIETKNENMTDKNNMQNEYKYQEVVTLTNVESITNDNHQVSTPSSPNSSAAALPDDLQLSESITSVYLHNSPTSQTLTNNIETTENPKLNSVNSITLMPYSKIANHMQETRKELTTVQSITENIFTVTPQYFSSTSPKIETTESSVIKDENFETTTTNSESRIDDKKRNNPTTKISHTLLEDMQSGQYHEISPGQYHEISPGQYHEQNPGQYQELHPGQYNELHPGQPGQYHNFEKSYSEDYEVNDVKVDFDHQDEHKIYNVQAKAGDFIIGEVGRIDVNNGQTLEGVRYTALEGEVDPLRISQILERFFGTGTS